MTVTVQSLPLELLLQVIESLDVISVIRLASVSSRFHEIIGTSKPFWLRYCCRLVQDEYIPISSFPLDSLGLPELVKLATRTERIVRAILPKAQPNLFRPQRRYFYLDHDPNFSIHSWTIEQAPGGRWVLALAGHVDDDTLHLMCWDSKATGEETENSILPVVNIQVKADSAPTTHFELTQPLYDPISHVFYCFITIGVDEHSGSGFRIVPVEMECSDDSPPSLRLIDHTLSWPEDGPVNSIPKFSGRWVTLGRGLSNDESDSMVWDSQTGQTSTYPLKHEHSNEKGFEKITVTHFGSVIRVHGKAHVDHLDLFLSPVSSNGPLTTPASFSVSASPEEREMGKHHMGPTLTNLGSVRLAHQEPATLLWIRWYSVSIMITASESGTFVELPRIKDGWCWDERLAPLWASYPPSHFNLSTTEEFQSDTGDTLAVDGDAFILAVKPYNLLDPSPQLTRALLALPPQPPHVKVSVNRWSCRGVCLRSGWWMFCASAQSRRWQVMLVRYD